MATTKLLAFHGDPAIKAKYLKRVRAHARADEIIKGIYWEDGKGCAVGCTIEGNKHDRYETELGIPTILAQLEDTIFESLPNGTAQRFPARFLNAIPIGADLSKVAAKFMVWQFEDKKYGLSRLAEVKEDAELMSVCTDLVALYKRIIAGGSVTDKEWDTIYDRAWAGARARAAWAWAWAGARAGAAWAWAWARARARAAWAWAGAWAGARARAAWAGAWAWAWARARADFGTYYEEAMTAAANKLIKLLREAE